jgi:antirestriction protein ArdC
MRKRYIDPRWMTYKQAAEHGWQVRKGEKATAIEFWEIGRGKEDEGESDADKPRSRMIHRVYSGFQCPADRRYSPTRNTRAQAVRGDSGRRGHAAQFRY